MLPRPNSHLLRRGRFSESGRAYLITAVVHQRRPMFSDWNLGRLLVAELKRAHDQERVNTMAGVVTPENKHWLVQIEECTLSQLMQTTKSRSTLTINRVLNRTGAFWQTGYHDRAIRGGEDLRPFARYIVANPLRAGLVEQIGDYPLWDACWL